MAVITYIALRQLQSGHVVNDTYSFEIHFEKKNFKTTSRKISKESLSGIPAHYLHNTKLLYDLQTVVVAENGAEAKNMREFLASCLGGETFLIDFYGTLLVPDNEISAQLTIEEFAETRVESSNFVFYPFSIREV